MIEHKRVCLKINGKTSVKSKNGLIKFNNYSKQLVVPFKIYADFEFALKGCKKMMQKDAGSNTSYTKKHQEHIPCSLSYKFVSIDDKFSKPVVLYRGKMWSTNSLKRFLISLSIVD